jgi:lysophospholipase L1-like esterase
MAHFKPNTDKKIIFHGNSLFNYGNNNIAFGNSISNYVRDNLVNKKSIFDYSQGGKTTTQIVSEFPTRIAPYFKVNDVYIFWDGINDLNTGKTVAQTLASSKTLATLAKAQGYKVYTLTCTSVNNVVVEPLRIQYNTLLLADTSFWDGVVDLTTIGVISDLNAYTNTTYFNADGVHFTTAGYNLIGQRIIETITF